ncbi:phage antirepressor N-terminal domain-containing protein, partial [Fusobacterium ulcerans]|uniref:phage antirepressor N-terminal domain-containing protein n=1 Tax=Fusobacterium ulcerans TaxID=861 RepID=UPI003FEDEC81
MNDLIVKEVEFNGEKLIGIYKEGKIYTPLKKFCEFLGVDFNGQHQRIRRDETLIKGVCKIHIPSEGGIQETLTLEISFLPLWLTGIKAQQCKEEIRENLIEFKLKAKDVLADAFLGKRTDNLKLAEISKKPDWIIK